MLPCIFQRFLLPQRLVAAEAHRLQLATLGMFERQIEELALLRRHVAVPAALHREARQFLRERIGGKGFGRAAMHVAAELVEQDHCGQQGPPVIAPAGGAALQHLAAKAFEARADLPIELVGLREPLLGHQPLEPEAEHFLGHHVDFRRRRP
jgi:hypothetical protein